jgi:hypothetical protein
VADDPKTNTDAEEELLTECREDFSYCKSYWSSNYEEAKKDIDAILCIPPAKFKDDRAGRPCLWPDELSQYVNATNNNLRQTKRSIKISPRGEQAQDKDAEDRQAYIQGIEYASKAQSVYATAFESCIECGFGYWRVNLIETGKDGEQEPRIRRIPNWATVWPDPNAKESDLSDSDLYFVTDTMRLSTFKRKYPKAKQQSFTGADQERAPGWLFGDNITVAEWWKRLPVKDEENKFKVTQRIVNGLEILETHEWIGNWIPIIGCFGLEKYQSNGDSSKRVFLSLIRRARDAQQMLAYIASQEAEEFGMAPRAPYLVIKGQVDPLIWGSAHKTPLAYLEHMIPEGWEPQWGPPPPPTRQPFVPNAVAYQAAFEQWRRSIQAAVGISPLPTAAQRQNEKSGIALQKIQSQEQLGSFHFTDNFVRALCNTGIQLNELISKLADLDSLPQTVVGKNPKGEDVKMRVAPKGAESEDPDSEHLPEADLFFAHRGEFEVGISDGPSDMSQREEVSGFVDTLLQSLPTLGLPPALTQQIVAIAIRLKNIGTYGDEIADMLAPPQDQEIPPQARAMVAKLQGELQQAMAEVQKLSQEKMGKITEGQFKMAQANIDNETKIAVAEITTKAQSLSERMSALETLVQQFHQQSHEIALQKDQQGADAQQAQQQVQAQSIQSAQDAAQAQSAPSQPAIPSGSGG